MAGALRVASELNDAVIVAIITDRGDRYLSSGLFRHRFSAPRRTPTMVHVRDTPPLPTDVEVDLVDWLQRLAARHAGDTRKIAAVTAAANWSPPTPRRH